MSDDDAREQREITYDNGDRYVGEFRKGKRDGKGTYYYNDGSKYEGEYRLGKRHGRGTYASVHGDKYYGEWKDGESHGEGVYQYVNGDRYEGQFKVCAPMALAFSPDALQDDVPHGVGTYRHANGDIYEGHFKDGYRDGKGKSIKANGGTSTVPLTMQRPAAPYPRLSKLIILFPLSPSW